MHRFVMAAALFAAVGCVDTNDDNVTDSGTTGPDPITADGIQVVCDDTTNVVTLTATVGGAPAAAVLNQSDFTNANPFQEEHNFSFDADGNIEPLALDIVQLADQTADVSTIFTCTDHFDEASAVMAYVVRAYDASDNLADCSAGSETDGDAQAYLDDGGTGPGTPPSNVEDFDSCDTDLAITY